MTTATRMRNKATQFWQEFSKSLTPKFEFLYPFRLGTPKGSDEPLDTDSQSHVQKREVEYLAAVNGSDVQNKEEWVRFIKAATATLSQPDAKREYDEERVRQNAAEMEGLNADEMGGLNADGMGGQNNSHSGLFIPNNQQTHLLELYNGITTDLKAYLDKADDPNKTSDELAKESYESLDRFNEKLVADFGDEYGKKHKLHYPLLKAKLREVSGLEKKIETAGDADKEEISRELETLQRSIQGYLVTRNLPGDWASLLHTPSPLELYNGITTDLKAYLDKADDPNKTSDELAKESYESLDRFNENQTPGGLWAGEKIETAGDADKEEISRELETLQRSIQRYLVTRYLPGDWASLLHTPPPPANFDTSINSKWDSGYGAYHRSSKDGNKIFISWKRKSNAVSSKDKIFLMTPTGLICEEVLKSDWQEFDSFAKKYPKYEYLKSVEDYKETDITGILDAWSQGGGKEKRYPAIYCLLEFKGDNVFRVASRSTAQSYQKGFKHSAVALCEGKGIKFEKPPRQKRD
ncbi:uncharacterized protein PG998_002963 [Apiospora kogelbergensis]|uniref:uncharacterized protein n=1 Tax=Apiospora kogelbergensis TaxID=1337665 RepID=UPI00312D55DA